MKTHQALSTALVLALAAGLPSTAEAQASRWSVEGRLGSTLPTGDLTDDVLHQTAGLAVGADVMYTMATNLSLYGGVGHHRFNCDGCDTDVTSTGLDAGAKLLFGSDERAQPWVRGGLMLHKPDVEGVEGDWNAGLDSGVGIDWRATDELVLVPALRYNTYGTEGDASLSYFTIDLGGHLHLGG